jgi:hypothetical protein
MRYRVYISFSAKDSMLAEDLKRRLNDVGVEFATITDNVNAGADYVRRAMRDAIRKSSEVIALLTDNSVNNQWVLYEVGMADSLEVPVTFVVVNEGVEKQLPIVGKHFVRYADLPEYLFSLKKRAKAA